MSSVWANDPPRRAARHVFDNGPLGSRNYGRFVDWTGQSVDWDGLTAVYERGGDGEKILIAVAVDLLMEGQGARYGFPTPSPAAILRGLSRDNQDIVLQAIEVWRS